MQRSKGRENKYQRKEANMVKEQQKWCIIDLNCTNGGSITGQVSSTVRI